MFQKEKARGICWIFATCFGQGFLHGYVVKNFTIFSKLVEFILLHSFWNTKKQKLKDKTFKKQRYAFAATSEISLSLSTFVLLPLNVK